jgi:hypothetical protein
MFRPVAAVAEVENGIRLAQLRKGGCALILPVMRNRVAEEDDPVTVLERCDYVSVN